MKIRYIVFCFILTIICSRSIAGPANPKPVKAIQPDGTEITLRVFGDEWLHFTETLDGYTVMKNSAGWWVYAQKNADGNLGPTNIIVKPPSGRSFEELSFLTATGQHIRPDVEIMREAIEKNPNRLENYDGKVRLLKPATSTTWNVLVLLVQFPDLAQTETKESFENMFNEDGWEGGIGSTGSFNNYYREVSYGKFGIEADVYGWFMTEKSYTYYSWSHSDKWDRARQLVAEVVDSAEAAGIDFSKYDNDGDGVVEQIIVVHAGHGAAQNGDTQYIWPHKYYLGNTLKKTYDGVEINNYTMQEELQYGRHAGIGMYCHEFGHALGLPDLYDLDFSSQGIGDWGLMGSSAWLNAGRTPSHFCPWCKEQLGWITPNLISSDQKISFNQIEFDESGYCRLNVPTSPSEYFLVENRQNIGYDTYLPGSGLLIWHIDSNALDNDDETHKLVDLEEADGRDEIDSGSRGDNGDPYPGSANNTTFDSHSYPNSLDYNGNYSVVSIFNISPSNSIMDADVNIDGLAHFNADVFTGNAPLIVHFTDASVTLSPVTTWAWDFDNDSIIDSNEQNPTWTFTEAGKYDVNLEISNDDITNSMTEEDYIRVFGGESALFFDGEGQMGTIPAKSSMNPREALTFEAWINPSGFGTQVGGLGRIIDKSSFYIYLQETATSSFAQNSLIFALKDQNYKKSRWNTPENSITLDEWQHIAVTYDTTNKDVEIYINGIKQIIQQSGSITGMILDNANYDLFIGNGETGIQTFQGAIDEVRLWNVARSEKQINMTMNNYLNGDEIGLIGYWKLDEGSGGVVKDSSPSAADGTVTSSWDMGKHLDAPVSIASGDRHGIPSKFQLMPNYPNPFSLSGSTNSSTPTTNISFALPVEAKVSIKIYNIRGQKVGEFLNRKYSRGVHTFVFSASNLSSGIYFYLINAEGSNGENFRQSRKMILVK